MLIAAPAGTSYTDTGLTNGTAYSYKVAAVDAAGNVSAQTAAVSGDAGGHDGAERAVGAGGDAG